LWCILSKIFRPSLSLPAPARHFLRFTKFNTSVVLLHKWNKFSSHFITLSQSCKHFLKFYWTISFRTCAPFQNTKYKRRQQKTYYCFTPEICIIECANKKEVKTVEAWEKRGSSEFGGCQTFPAKLNVSTLQSRLVRHG
jgi:hypothetical protein